MFIKTLRGAQGAKHAASMASHRVEALREAMAREDEELIAEENEELELQRQNESLLAELAALRHKYSSLEESMRVNDQEAARNLKVASLRASKAQSATVALKAEFDELTENFEKCELRLTSLRGELEVQRHRAEAAERANAAAQESEIAAEASSGQAQDRIHELEAS